MTILAIMLLFTSCSSINDSENELSFDDVKTESNYLQDSDVFPKNIIDLDKLGFVNKKELDLVGEGRLTCKMIAYENEISENSEESRIFEKTSINIKYPEFIYVVKKDNGFNYGTLGYTRIINHLVKSKAMNIYFWEYGVYFHGINSRTNYDIKLLDNHYLSILFKMENVESTRYTHNYALNIDLRKEELYTPVRYAVEMDKIGKGVMLQLSDFLTKDEILIQLENDKYKVYHRNQEITDDNKRFQIIFALKENIDSYFYRDDKFYITKEFIGFISDEIAHKGDSNEVLVQRLR